MKQLADRLGWAATVIACIGMAVVVLSGCQHPTAIKPPCVSYCGMLLEDESNGAMSCDKINEVEAALIMAGSELEAKDKRFNKENACRSIFGWQLKLSKYEILFDSEINNGAPFVGSSDCRSKVMTLTKKPNWRKGSYPHEFFHVVQDCETPKAWGNSHPEGAGGGHGGWEENGVYDIIDDFREGRR